MLTEFINMRKRSKSFASSGHVNHDGNPSNASLGVIPAAIVVASSILFHLKKTTKIFLFELWRRRVSLFKWGTLITVLGFIFVGINVVAITVDYNNIGYDDNLKRTTLLEDKEVSKPTHFTTFDSDYQASNFNTSYSSQDVRTDKDLRHFSNKEMHHVHSKCSRSITPMEFSTTLVSQTTLDRLLLMKETCQRWTSPIVMVVCVTPEELNGKWKKTEQEYSKVCPHMKLIPFQVRDEHEKIFKYPINVMRNRGLDEVATSHVLIVDADFIPSVDLDKAIKTSIQLGMEQDDRERDIINDNTVKKRFGNIKANAATHGPFYRKHALVIPAYERKLASKICQRDDFEACLQLSSMDPEFMPQSMESLEKCVRGYEDSQHIIVNPSSKSTNTTKKVKKSKCFVFHSDYFPRGHADTQSDAWLKENRTDALRPIPCIDNDFYEPYVVLPWCPTDILNHESMNTYPKPSDPWAPLSPYYDERFYGYGKNKIQNILHLQQKGYAFSVIPALGFLTHHPHPLSNAKKKWRGLHKHHDNGDKNNIKAEMRNLLKKYKREVIKEYKGKVRMLTETCTVKT